MCHRAEGMRAEGSLADLRAGNLRFREDQAECPRRGSERRALVATRQTPKAAILTCSDSRVAPEILFDQGLGDLFVVRTAGHVLDRGALGSLEYAVEHLRVPLVLVLGHSHCGAVTAAVHGTAGQGGASWLVDTIRPAVAAVAQLPGDGIVNATREHLRRTAALLLTESAVVREAIERHEVRLETAIYDLVSGGVELTA